MNSLEISIESFISKLTKLSSTVLWDCCHGNAMIIEDQLTNYTPKVKIAGPVFLINTNGNILPILQALDKIPPNHILVINDISKKNKSALLGDIIVQSAKSQNLAGIIVFGNIRDIDMIDKIGLPVWARGVSIQAAKLGESVDSFPEEIIIDNGTLRNGDWLIGDMNGMIIIQQEKLRLVIKSAEVKNRKENCCVQRILSGEMIAKQMNLEAFLCGKGDLVVEF